MFLCFSLIVSCASKPCQSDSTYLVLAKFSKNDKLLDSFKLIVKNASAAKMSKQEQSSSSELSLLAEKRKSCESEDSVKVSLEFDHNSQDFGVVHLKQVFLLKLGEQAQYSIEDNREIIKTQLILNRL